MKLVPVLWHEISVKNISPNYTGRQDIGAGTVNLM